MSHVPLAPATTPDNGSASPRASADGAFVVFLSAATDLVAGQSDDNWVVDVFLYERATGDTRLVSHTPDSPTTTGRAINAAPQISADGAYVTFASVSDNLVAGQSDSNGHYDVFLYERITGEVTLVSHLPGSPTTAGNRFSSFPSMSAAGAQVTFQSEATDLVTGQSDLTSPPTPDVFVFERSTGVVNLASHVPASANVTGNGGSHSPSISADGAHVVFASHATNLVTRQKDANAFDMDVFVFERSTGAVSLVSRVGARRDNGTANAGSAGAAISADGALVVFTSLATNLVHNATDHEGSSDVFLFERATGTIRLVSHVPASTTTTADGISSSPFISADGAYVTFTSTAGNLLAGQRDDNLDSDVFLYERATGSVTLVSHTAANATTAADGPSDFPTIAANGGFVAFRSGATNLVAGQTEGAPATTDIFLFERATGLVTLVSHAAGSPTTTANASSSTLFTRRGPLGTEHDITAAGTFVAFLSAATNLVPDQSDTNGQLDVFLFQRSGSAVTAT